MPYPNPAQEGIDAARRDAWLATKRGLTPQGALALARRTWPNATLRRARKDHICDNLIRRCGMAILKGDYYIDPGDSNPSRAGGFGGYRYCVICVGG